MISKKIVFPDELRQRFKSFITGRSGLYFKDHELKGLEDIIASRMETCGFDTILGYYNYLTTSEKREDELRELLNKLTINHTYFFRNESQFKALKETVLPEIIKQKYRGFDPAKLDEKPVIRIWSAGCSTGEEAYSIAMIVSDVISDTEAWNIQIIATDASSDALEKARSAIYSGSSIKHLDKEHIDKYFIAKPKTNREVLYAVSGKIKDMVTFGFHNLIEDEFPPAFDIIFCRNVVIYFELDTTINIMNKFYSSLKDAGYLFIGYSESLYFMPNKFKMVSWDEAIYYRKAIKGESKRFEEFKPVSKEKNLDDVLEELSKAERLAEITAEAKKIKEPPKNVEDILVEAIKYFHLKKYEKSLSLTEKAVSLNKEAIDAYYLAAEIYFNRGKLEEAKKKLSTALKFNTLFAPAHYLYGCIWMEENANDKAKASLKKAIFIDKDFSLAYFYLAHLYKNEGRSEEAIREYRNTLKVLSKSKTEDILAYGGGFNVEMLTGACRDNIERLRMES